MQEVSFLEASSKLEQLTSVIGWGWLARLAGQPPHMDTIHMNQPVVLLSHINEPATIRTSQPNRLILERLLESKRKVEEVAHFVENTQLLE